MMIFLNKKIVLKLMNMIFNVEPACTSSQGVCIQLFQLRLSPSKAEKSNTSAKSLLGVTIKNTQTEQNLVSRDTI